MALLSLEMYKLIHFMYGCTVFINYLYIYQLLSYVYSCKYSTSKTLKPQASVQKLSQAHNVTEIPTHKGYCTVPQE